ncbi:hypothetical protein LTS08_008377 [Lithohypha guttulata]|nr:hypothetical protein LTS08_008377 [Lithohypha guttulata]
MRSFLLLRHVVAVVVAFSVCLSRAENYRLQPEIEVEVKHVTTLLVQVLQPNVPLLSPRHEIELSRLRVQLKHGAIKGESKSIRHRVLEALYGFETYKHGKVARYQKLYQNVSQRQRKILDRAVGYSDTLLGLEKLKAVNEDVCHEIVRVALAYYRINRQELDEFMQQEQAANRQPDHESVSQALKLFVRDWAIEGHNERHATFPCIESYLKDNFESVGVNGGSSVEILVPGAGLGRLAHEIAGLNANEWSSFVNGAYHFLEANTIPDTVSMYPFLDIWSHLKSRDEMLRRIGLPDVTVNTSQVLLVEGDFTRVFKKSPAKFDAIVTLFFIDTARNLMNYLETIKQLLKPGGLWINSGPLLYGISAWVQLSLEEIIQVVEEMGFKFLNTDSDCGDITLEGYPIRGKEALYNFNSSSLSKYAYVAQHWVARKRPK